MNYSALKIVLLLAFLCTIECFANTTEYITKIATVNTPHITMKTSDILSYKDSIKEPVLITMSILEFIKEHTDPFKRKNERQGSFIKSTKWIKDPNWIKKELV